MVGMRAAARIRSHALTRATRTRLALPPAAPRLRAAMTAIMIALVALVVEGQYCPAGQMTDGVTPACIS